MIALLAAGLSGCASGGSIGGLFNSTGSSQQETMRPAPVTFAPVIGAPANVAKQLSEQLDAAARQQNIPVVAPKEPGAVYTVRGYLAASPEAGQTKIAYIWDVTDAKGQRSHRITGEEVVPSGGSNPWARVDQSATQRIATKTASELAAWLPKQAAPAAQPAAQTASRSASGEVLAFVPEVTGAPGDGEKSLTLAIKKQLFKGGIKLANGQGSNVHVVRGTVKMGEPSGGKQSISIDWQVIDPSGRRLGTVSQKNTIEAGSLDGAWGPVADAAAAAATDGILKLLPKPQT